MTAKELLAKLVEEGACIRLRTEGHFDTLAVCEIVRRRLFWVSRFPQDQHHAHVRTFTRAVAVGDCRLDFYKGQEPIIYIAAHSFWPEHREKLDRERRDWLRFLADPANLRYFTSFAEEEKRLHTGPAK